MASSLLRTPEGDARLQAAEDAAESLEAAMGAEPTPPDAPVEATHPCMGVQLLSCDPVLEGVLRAGRLPLRDLRAVAGCVGTEEVRGAVRAVAARRLQSSAATLRALRRRWEGVVHGDVGALLQTADQWLLTHGVPAHALWPSLSAPLAPAQIAPPALLGDLSDLSQRLRAALFPDAWAFIDRAGGPWAAVAASTGIEMRAALALALAATIPVEARLAHLTLRHAAYKGPGVETSGEMALGILRTMCMYQYGPKELPRLARQLRGLGGGGPSPGPFSLYLLRRCRRGADGNVERRAKTRADLAASLEALLRAHGDAALRTPGPWLAWALQQDERLLVGFYIQYLYHGFQ